MRDTSACCRIEEQGRRDGAQEDHSGGLNKWRSEGRPFPPWRRQEPLLARGLYKGLHKCVVVLLRNTAIQLLNIDMRLVRTASKSLSSILPGKLGTFSATAGTVSLCIEFYKEARFLESASWNLAIQSYLMATEWSAPVFSRSHNGGGTANWAVFTFSTQFHKLPPDALIYNLKGNERGKAIWGKHANCRWALTLILTYWFWIDYLKHCQHQSVKIRALCGGWSNRLCILAQVYRC